jgi:hypothetical protein
MYENTSGEAGNRNFAGPLQLGKLQIKEEV